LPRDFHRKLRTVNGLELINREIKRRTRVATIFPNSASCLRLVSALLIEIHEEWLQLKMPYLHMGQRKKSCPSSRSQVSLSTDEAVAQ
jgi:transposase-like protein